MKGKLHNQNKYLRRKLCTYKPHFDKHFVHIHVFETKTIPQTY